MRKYSLLLMLALILSLGSCQVIQGIFNAGVWAGVLMVVVVIALIIVILAKLFGGK